MVMADHPGVGTIFVLYILIWFLEEMLMSAEENIPWFLYSLKGEFWFLGPWTLIFDLLLSN